MEIKQKARLNMDMTQRLYWRILPILILSNLISRTSFIDSIFVGQFLGTDILAITSLYNPLNTFITGINTAIVIGTKQACCTAIGTGDTNHLNRIFNSICKCFIVFGVIMTVIMILFRAQFASLLGASGELNGGCATYIFGCALDVLPSLFFNLLLPFLMINGENSKSYIIIIINLAVGVLTKYIFLGAFDMNALGLGLSNLIGHLVCLAIMLPIYLNDKNLVHFDHQLLHINKKDFIQVIYGGSPTLTEKAGRMVKDFLVNTTLLSTSTISAVAVVTLQSALVNFTTSLVKGIGDSVHMLSGYYVGEGNRPALNKVFHTALIATLLLGGITLSLILVFQDGIIDLYGIIDAETISIAKRMIPIECVGVMLNILLTILFRLFQSSNQLTITNTVSFLQNLLPGIFTCVFVRIIGTDAAWLAFATVSALCLMIMFIYGIKGGKGSLKDITVFLHFPKDFGVSEEDRIALTIKKSEQVVEVADKVADFCKSRGASKEIAQKATLFVEEMASNVTDHGFTKMKHPEKGRVWVSAIYKNDTLTVRIRDNCVAFDPKEYLVLKQAEQYRALGIQLVIGLADEVVYQNVFGMNMLNIELKSATN